MRHQQRGKNEKRPVIDTVGVVSRGGSGSVIMRGPVRGGPVRRGGRSGIRFLVFIGFLFALYWLAGSFRNEIVERLPAAYPVLKAMGYDVAEPAGFGLRAEVLRVDRYRDELQSAHLLINGMVVNARSERVQVPRLRLVITSSRHPPMTVIADAPQPSLGPGERTRFEVRHKTGVTLFDVKVSVSFEK